MGMNRRNVLIGLGAVAVGGGAAFGSGAFSQVEANRSFTVEAAGDSGAYLQLSPDATSFVSTSTTGNNGQNILTVDLSSLNDNATTTIDAAFTVTNSLSEGVGVRIRSNAYSGGEASGLTIKTSANQQDLDTYPGAASDDNNLDPSGGTEPSLQVRLVIDTSQLDVSNVSELTISADTSEYIA